jgi:hypothetical protein
VGVSVGDTREAGRAPARAWWMWILVLAALILVYLTYRDAFSGDARRLGWDPFAYMWQARAIALGDPGVTARPGVPVLTSWFAQLLNTDAPRAVSVFVLLAPILVGAAAVTALRAGVRAPMVAIPVIALVAATWIGTGRNAGGYFASLLAAVLLTAATGILARRGARGLAFVLVTAGFLAHPLFYALFLGVSVLWGALVFLLDRPWTGASLRRAFAGPAVVLGGGLVGAACVFLLAGVSLRDISNAGTVSAGFHDRTTHMLRLFRPWALGPLIVVGSAAAWAVATTREARDTLLLWLTWLLVTVGGIAASLAGFEVPGARLLLFAVPFAFLAALGVFADAALIRPRMNGSRVAGLVRAGLALVVLGALLAALVPWGPHQLEHLRRSRGDVRRVAAHVGAYLERLPSTPPVIVLMDLPGLWGAYQSKYLLNVLRTSVPDEFLTRTEVYLGSLHNLLAGRPTFVRAGAVPQSAVYNEVSQRTWEEVRPLLRDDPVVLVLMRFSELRYSRLLAEDPNGLVANGVYAVRGPRIRAGPAPQPPPFGAVGMTVATALLLVALVLVGSGWARWATRRIGLGAIDLVLAAPVAGAAVLVLVGFLLALSPIRLNPVSAWVAAAGAGGAGWAVAGHGFRFRGSRVHRFLRSRTDRGRASNDGA